MKSRLAVTLLVAAAALPGCAPTDEMSGWELVPDREREQTMEVFPEIPVILPHTPEVAEVPEPDALRLGVLRGTLDEGSLFRRGYSAPTP